MPPHPPRGPIETFPDGPHAGLIRIIAERRLDDIERCRDRLKLPPIRELLARSTVIPGVSMPRVQEASLQQTFLFEVASTTDAYVVDSVEVESSLEFPAPDGSMRHAAFDDVTLDRCLEGALNGMRFEASGARTGERFWVQGHIGEAVYDLPRQ